MSALWSYLLETDTQKSAARQRGARRVWSLRVCSLRRLTVSCGTRVRVHRDVAAGWKPILKILN